MKDKKTNIVVASGVKRILAYVIDWYLGFMFGCLPILYLSNVINQKTTVDFSLSQFSGQMMYVVLFLALLFSIFYYFVVPTFIYRGQTIGKRMLKIRVVGENGNCLSIKQSFIRQVIGVMILESSFMLSGNLICEVIGIVVNPLIGDILSYVFLGLFVISLILVYKKNRSLHDLFVKSIVIENK
ncbi:MAG: RDD family protein [Erysipelotrichaceae bacterium]